MENTQIGPFKIGSRLGNNRRQKVYRAKQIEQGIDVALKFIGLPSEEKRQRAIDKIQIEVERLKKLSHPNLVALLGAGFADDQIFLATELVKGESLTAKLARRGKLAADQVIEYGRQIAQVLDYLHNEKIIHSKLTPDKILIAKDGTVKVTDLRLNRAKKRRWDASRKRELDIAAYMAPEQFVDGATEKSDIYALGIILYEMLTGKLPYEPDTMDRMTRKKMTDKAPTVSKSTMNCPVWLDKMVCQMISPDPRMRPHTAKAVVLALEELKSLDASKKSAVSLVSGNFNPLTAGAEKTEANRLLGKKPREDDIKPSFFQSTAFLFVGLIGIVAILTYALMPASSKQNLEYAQQLMQSDEASDWRNARNYVKGIIENGTSDECFDGAEALYFESRRRTLVIQAEKGRSTVLQSAASQKFIAAVQAQESGDLASSRNGLIEILSTVDPAGDERHIHAEASIRINDVTDSMDLNIGGEALNALIDENRNLDSTVEKNIAIRLLDRIIAKTEAVEDLHGPHQSAVELKKQYTQSMTPGSGNQ